jgi:hypothetical protein
MSFILEIAIPFVSRPFSSSGLHDSIFTGRHGGPPSLKLRRDKPAPTSLGPFLLPLHHSTFSFLRFFVFTLGLLIPGPSPTSAFYIRCSIFSWASARPAPTTLSQHLSFSSFILPPLSRRRLCGGGFIIFPRPLDPLLYLFLPPPPLY